ncbi:MAG: peptide-methionine (R)-S-oxide reductase MsrB [Candidatus Methanofastidiosa archaeon]|nr:peptide-methionine (R)-S-oxide reductase MsrB [Candidatus Methanofastidiosa archaeon]
MKSRIEHTEEEWRKLLSPQAFAVLREKGTEPPFSGKYNDFKKRGTFVCAGCGNELFSSDTKYNSGSGWPSFWQPVSPDAIDTQEDLSHNASRTEVLCARCGGHLGHVFDDGPPPTGKRYCMNSLALDFKQD